ncbi:TPA: YhgE/Pip family protein [Streptococcus suis]
MKNIFTIFKRDLQKINGNVIALIVLLGICIVPCLYAWFNIAASWDPYTNTEGIKVAVVNEDKGFTGNVFNLDVNVGDKVISKLSSDKKLGWDIVSNEEAMHGIDSGKYYAAIVIPEDFSKNMMSLFSNHIEDPEILFYSNEKKNAIAPKVTEKQTTSLQNEINAAFSENLYKIAYDTLNTMNVAIKDTDKDEMVENLLTNLNSISRDMHLQIRTIGSFEDLAKSIQSTLTTTNSIVANSALKSDALITSLQNQTNELSNLDTNMSHLSKGIDEILSTNEQYFKALSDVINQTEEDIKDTSFNVNRTFKDVSNEIQILIERNQKVKEDLEKANAALPIPLLGIDRTVEKFASLIDQQTILKNKIDSNVQETEDLIDFTNAKKEELNQIISDSKSNIAGFRDDFRQDFSKDIDQIVGNIEDTSNKTISFINSIQKSGEQIDNVTGQLDRNMNDVIDILIKTRSELESASSNLDAMIARIENPESGDKMDTIRTILSEGPTVVTTFLAAPVHYQTEKLYPIENYGSAMTPFYSTLAIWVGGVVLVAMMSVNPTKNTLKDLTNLRDYQVYLGRYLLFALIALIQSTLIILGDVFYLGVQVESIWYLLLAGWITSLVYVNVIYTLTVSFGDIGKAICVVLMVMQVAGSGGTFPIEVAPEFFKKVYPLLPFVHSMNAMRECIGGFYGNTYWYELGILLTVLIPSLLLGLLLRRPIIRFNEAFMEKLEETKIM